MGECVKVLMRMQYSGNQGNPSPVPLMKGGGIIPPVLLEESRVPRFYKDAIASCGAVNPSQLPNTTCVYNLMIASGLPRSMLSYIWTIVNRTLPGQLTRQEFYSCLALIALAQQGQTLCALSFVTTLPVPHLQLSQSLALQGGQGQQSFKKSSIAPNCSAHHYGNTAIPSSLQRSAVFPTSISVQNFGQHQFPSPAESAALCFTRSLDVRSSQRTASNSKQTEDSDTILAFDKGHDLMKTSQSIPANVNFAASVSGAQTTVNELLPSTTTMGGLIPVTKESIMRNPSPDNAALQRSQMDLATSLEKATKDLQNTAPSTNPLDFLINLSVPSTSANIQQFIPGNQSDLRSSSALKTIPKASFESRVGINDESGTFSVFEKHVNQINNCESSFKNSERNPATSSTGTGESFDMYAAVKLVEGSVGAHGVTERIAVWQRCIDEALKIFESGETLLSSYSKQAIEIVAQTEKGSRYFLALRNVFEMVGRIAEGRDNELFEKKEALKVINTLWEKFKNYVYFSEDLSKSTTNGLLIKKCRICLTEITVEALLEFAGNDYHKHCANFWTNRVNSVLPKLS